MKFFFGYKIKKVMFSLKICRHGDRTIQVPYKNDPFLLQLKKIFPEGYGQLTNVRNTSKMVENFENK